MADGKPGAPRQKRNAALSALGARTPAPEAEPDLPARAAKSVAKIMVYTHPKVARKFKEIAFNEDRKTNDVILEALDLYLTKAGHRGIKYVIEH